MPSATMPAAAADGTTMAVTAGIAAPVITAAKQIDIRPRHNHRVAAITATHVAHAPGQDR